MKRPLALAIAACGHPAPIAVRPPPPPAHPIDAAVAVAVAPPDAVDPCDGLAEETASYELQMHAFDEACSDDPEHCGPDFPGPPTCEAGPIGIEGDSPFTGALACRNHDSTYGDPECTLTISTTDTVAVDFGFEITKRHQPILDRAHIVDDYLVIEMHSDNTDVATVVVCRARPLACTPPLPTAGDDDTGAPWTTAVRIDRDRLVLDRATGNPPPIVLAPHRLVF